MRREHQSSQFRGHFPHSDTRSNTRSVGGFRLNQQTGTRVRLDVASVDHAVLRAAAHRCGATVNDSLLVAVSAALRKVLLDRGESLDSFAVTIPVSIRAADSPTFGNMVSPAVINVPAVGPPDDRLRHVHSNMLSHKATTPAPIALLGPLFRLLAAVGGFRWYMRHQRRFHTLVSYVRGPTEPVHFGGHLITAAIPVALGGMGNVAVYFEALSYAGTLTVSAISDLEHFPLPEKLTAALRDELAQLMSGGTM